MRKNPQRGRACASSRIQRRSAVRSCARLVRYRAARLNGASLQDRTQLTWKVAGNQPARGAVRASRIVKFRLRVAEWADDEPAAHADTDFPLKSSATRRGSIIASCSASETWRTCWPPGVSKSPMRPSGNGVGGSVLSMRADCGAEVAGSETPGISTSCSSRSRVASSTCGAPWMRPVTSSTSSCNRDGIGTPRCDSFASY